MGNFANALLYPMLFKKERKKMENKINIIQKRIESKAKQRFEADIKQFTDAVSKTNIGKKLRIKVSGTVMYSLVNQHGIAGGTFFNSREETECAHINTNFLEIKKELINKYIEEESDNLIEKIGLLKEYIGELYHE